MRFFFPFKVAHTRKDCALSAGNRFWIRPVTKCPANNLSLFFGTSLRTGRVHSMTGRVVFHETIYWGNAWIWPNGSGKGSGTLSRRPSLGIATDTDKPNTKPFCWYTFIALRCTVVHENVARSLRATYARHVPSRIASRTKHRRRMQLASRRSSV